MESIDSIQLTKENAIEDTNLNSVKFPYLIFRLNDKYYAVNCSLVSGIMKLPNNIVKTPCPSQYVYGIFELRGEFIPMVALRTLFNMSDVESERFAFSNCIDERIDDHLNWVEELRRCTYNHEPFTLGTDHSQCRLGQWLSTYKTNSYAIQTQIQKINPLHMALHQSVKKLMEESENLNEDDRDVALSKYFDYLDKEYIAKLVGYLEELKILHNESLLEMVVVLESGNNHIAVIADEIVSVEDMDTEYEIDNIQKIDASRYISGVRRSASLNKDILIIDEAVLIDTIVSII